MKGGGPTSSSAIPTVEPRWVEPGEVPPEAVQSLQAALSLPEVLCALLVKRDLADPGRAKAFLRPLLSELDVPDALAGMVPATERVLAAVRTGEMILAPPRAASTVHLRSQRMSSGAVQGSQEVE